MFDDPNVVLHCEKIDKIYPGTKALDSVSFDVLRGKINVLIGENGAGKSTLMKIIAGIEQPSDGKMYMDGREVSFKDTNAARKYGVGIIHQELSLFPNLNIYQNIYAGHEIIQKGHRLDVSAQIRGAKAVLERLEHPKDPNALVGDLRVGQQQMVEIARNLVAQDLKILIMDEPTSSLSSAEVKVLFKIMRELTAAGISIVYISHRLEEIMEIGDHATILRDGKYVADAEISDINLQWIVRHMVGGDKSYTRYTGGPEVQERPVILETKDLCLPKKGGGWLLDHVNIKLHKGEVLGIYGLLGAGRTEFFECLMGLRPEHIGEIWLNGKQIHPKSVAGQIAQGLVMVPEDRQRDGLVQTLDIEKNISLSGLKNYYRHFHLDKKEEDAKVDEQIQDTQIKVVNKTLPILSLSGGNQQKVVIAKGVLTDPQILLLDEPSRGIDIGAKTEVFDIIHDFAMRGMSLIVISSELKEIIAAADRIYVLSNGKCTVELTGDQISEDQLVLASYAGYHTEPAAVSSTL